MEFAEIMALIQIADQLAATAMKLIKFSKERTSGDNLTPEEKQILIKRIEIAKESLPEW